ncbi:hypothetical protein [Xanthomonas bromi]|uniref:hypothetical protein n=1 Tax=Xanthomonas bromi TaxID=56449 RepID=UPI00111272B2|nr:hypothetical protein [Xanthomonas bromi]
MIVGVQVADYRRNAVDWAIASKLLRYVIIIGTVGLVPDATRRRICGKLPLFTPPCCAPRRAMQRALPRMQASGGKNLSLRRAGLRRSHPGARWKTHHAIPSRGRSPERCGRTRSKIRKKTE